ncbi:hypothetical protein EDB87DRAFT_1593004 [Lactarius vividus]|nr:hypothetical protein EDB87DRAFT_1593004 [Lactarius vividus]
MNLRPPALEVQLTQIDYSLDAPDVLDNTTLPKVPVLRIYGSSSLGQKCCLHIHQVYPYFFVEYTGKMNPGCVRHYIVRLTESLNYAIAVSLKRNPQSPRSRFVRTVVLVKGVHFYGFNSSHAPFLKIHIVDPALMSRAVTIMQSGSVMGTPFHTFESHLSYVLQFLCDFGLYGCGWVQLQNVWQRGVDDDGGDPISGSSFEPSVYFRQSRMTLEFDTVAPLIMNRHNLSPRNLHHKLTIPQPPASPESLVLGVRELWDDERRRRIAAGLPPSPDLPQDPSANSRGAGGGWAAEARLWDQLKQRIEKERDVELDARNSDWERWVMTTFESIEVLWEDKYRVWRPDRQAQEHNLYADSNGSSPQDVNPTSQSSVEVDEALLFSQELSTSDEQEDALETNVGPDDKDNDLTDYDPTEDDSLEDVDDTDDPQQKHPRPPNSQSSQEHQNTTTPKSSQVLSKGEFRTPHKRRRPFPETVEAPVTSFDARAGRADTFVFPSGPAISAQRYSRVASSRRIESEGHTVQEDHAGIKISRGAAGKRLTLVSDATEHFFLPASSESMEEIDTDDTTIRLPHTRCVDNIIPNVDHLLSGTGESFEVDADVWSDSADERPMKRLKVAVELNTQEPMSRLNLVPTKGRTIPRTQDPYIFTIQAKKEIKNAFVYNITPPLASELLSTLESRGLPSKLYQDPYYSKAEDVPERPWEFAGLVYRLKKADGLGVLEEWESASTQELLTKKIPAEDRNVFEDRFDKTGVGGWEYASSPPSVREVRKWLKSTARAKLSKKLQSRSQIDGVTPVGPYGLKDTLPVQGGPSGVREKQTMTVFALEVFAPSRGELVPDPRTDALVAAFYSFNKSGVEFDSSDFRRGVIIVGDPPKDSRTLCSVPSQIVATELDLLNATIDLVLELDPDIITGWEIQSSSWGYLGARGSQYGLDVEELISRAPGRVFSNSNDPWALRNTSTFRASGRHVLNAWRLMRTELELSSYTLENTAFHLLHRRTPKYRFATLTEWYNSPVPAHRARLLRHLLGHSTLVLEMLDTTDIVAKTAEFARVFGVDFFSVISRGSQFKVESFMFRIAKPESFVLRSPNKHQVGAQNAAECMPLIMEPLSAFYNSPIVVLDFQSLYPSVMIAYNYCYSTCLGRVTSFKDQYKLGVAETNLPPGLLPTLQDHITVAPNGIMYVKPEVRKGLLGRMLTELLDTRVMVKQAMKRERDNKVLARTLDARQLGLKYIANVTYGYTSATFSGRMPAVEIADSIVQSGRETLEKAIQYIDSNEKWGARVVYGDTDSLFVYLKGKTKEQAFRIGYDIADAVTRLNPVPVKLKFEKVYLPCVLMAKKRYVGFKYENPDDTEPVFDAKGIETVRRDGVPAQKKMTEASLKILFRTQDLSDVKRYCYESWKKILENKVSIQDFIFSREVRMGTYSDKGPPPPGAVVAARRQLEDPNNEAQYGDRIPYVIARGAPHERLVDRAVALEEFYDSEKQLDGSYYISRVLIPPLERIFNLVGADVRGWYEEMPRRIRADDALMSPEKAKGLMTPGRLRIEEHFRNSQCILCRSFSDEGLCEQCRCAPAETMSGLLSQVRISEKRLQTVHDVCTVCTWSEPLEPVRCTSLDCPWFFQRKKVEKQVEDVEILQGLIQRMEMGSETLPESRHDSGEPREDDDETKPVV